MSQHKAMSHVELEFLEEEGQPPKRSWVDVKSVDFGSRPYLLEGYFHAEKKRRTLPINRIRCVRERGSRPLDPIDYLDRLILRHPGLAKRTPRQAQPRPHGEALAFDGPIWVTLLGSVLVLAAIVFGLTR